MCRLRVLSLVLASLNLSCIALASPLFPWTPEPPSYNSSIRPLVIWHGLGDSYASVGMIEFAELVREVHPGLYVHRIWIEENMDKDQKAGFFGNVNEQLERVNEQLNDVPELKNGFDALGFSQGGQFLRAYVERYNAPPVHNLITFGSQHMGVSDLPLCKPRDWLCLLARRAAKSGVYSSYAQSHVVQAQYFRDHARLESYRAAAGFLADINGEADPDGDRTGSDNEEGQRNAAYARNLKSLNSLVLILFSEDKTVVPKESSWFGSYVILEDDKARGTGWLPKMENSEILQMRLQPLYVHDWIGLRELDKRGDVHLLACEGEHMQITRDCWEPIIAKYAGGVVDEKEEEVARSFVVQAAEIL